MIPRPCSRCRRRPRARTHRWCLKCVAAYNRETRKPYAELSVEEKRKRLIRNETRRLIQAGKLKPTRCPCGCRRKVEPHHVSYDNPRAVVFVCHPAHRLLEAVKRRARRAA